MIQFKTTLLTAGKTATGIKIPDAVMEKLNAGKKPPVIITINGYSYRNTVAVMGGEFMVGVSAEHRKGAGISGGDTITVAIALDTEPRIAEVPEDLKKALNKNKKALKNFDALSYSKKRAITEQLKTAKTEETRMRRIEKVLQDLQNL